MKLLQQIIQLQTKKEVTYLFGAHCGKWYRLPVGLSLFNEQYNTPSCLPIKPLSLSVS